VPEQEQTEAFCLHVKKQKIFQHFAPDTIANNFLQAFHDTETALP
jgi:hypothetical protein